MRDLTVLILAAGKGTRMKSSTAKVLHPLAGLPMLEFVLRTARRISGDIHVVVGHQAEAVQAAVAGHPGVGFIVQTEQLGTGHAVMAARDAIGGTPGNVLILPGDVPLIRPETLEAFVGFHAGGGFRASVLTAIVDDPAGYGRVLREGDAVERIVEHRDADDRIREIREINAGIYVFDTGTLFTALAETRTDNAQKEYYLTDVAGVLAREGSRMGALTIPDAGEASGINSRSELAAVDRTLRDRKREALMASGVSLMDPASAWIDADVQIAPDSTIHPAVTIEGASTIGSGVTVRSYSRITNSRVGDGSTLLEGCVVADSEIRENVQVGPYAHLRAGTVLEPNVSIGNFVEVKKSRIGEGSKARHLAYIGDADIGRKVNYGAGSITCNYDGENKHRTVIEDGVFIGSDSQLIAPVRIGKGAYVAAGSSVHEDVPPGSLAVARARQVVKEGWVEKRKKPRE